MQVRFWDAGSEICSQGIIADLGDVLMTLNLALGNRKS